jgi:membrane-associated phospholipid phosphatase
MYFYLHYLVFAPLLLLALLWFSFPTRHPWRLVADAIAATFKRPGGRALLGCYLFAVVTNLVEALFDERLTAALGYDFTAKVRSVEGPLVELVQDGLLAMPGGDVLIAVLALAYTSGYVAWLLFPSFAFFAMDRPRAAGSYALAFAANYAFALPFYLFFPVREVAWSGLSSARPLLEEHWPGITEPLRMESALDNCFPSLHVSIAVTALYFVVRYGTRRMKIVGWPLAILISFSVLALAIHWGVDTLAGIPFGLLCATFGESFFRPESASAAPR